MSNIIGPSHHAGGHPDISVVCLANKSIFRTHFGVKLQSNIAFSMLMMPIANKYSCAMTGNGVKDMEKGKTWWNLGKLAKVLKGGEKPYRRHLR